MSGNLIAANYDPSSIQILDPNITPTLEALAIGARKGYRTVLFGDSMVDTYETIVTPVTGIYDSITGILTATSNGHQQAVGWFITIWNRSFAASNKLFLRPVLTIPNANTFTVNIGTGLTIDANNANWRYRPQSWRSAQNFIPWLQGASGHRFEIVYNGGANGDRTDEALARIDVDCLNYKPDIVICQMPGINDLSSAYPERDLESIIDSRHAIVDRITAANSLLIILTTTGVVTGHAQATINSGAKVREMNKRLIEYCRTKSGAIIFDAWKTTIDPTSTTGTVLANYHRSTDLTHYSMRGGRLVGEALWSQISMLFPTNYSTLPASIIDSFTASALTLSAVTINVNGICSATVSASGLRAGDRRKVQGGSPIFNEFVTILSAAGTAITFASTNTPGSVTGTILIGGINNFIDTPLWTTATGGTLAGGVTGVAASGIKAIIITGIPTVAASVVARADGFGNDQQLVITAAAAGNQVSLEGDFNWASSSGSINWPSKVKSGRRYVFEGEISLVGVSGSNLTEIRPVIVTTIDGTTYQVYALNGYADGAGLNTDLIAYHFKTAPMVLPLGASITLFKWQFLLSFSAAGTALTVKLGRCRLDEFES